MGGGVMAVTWLAAEEMPAPGGGVGGVCGGGDVAAG